MSGSNSTKGRVFAHILPTPAFRLATPPALAERMARAIPPLSSFKSKSSSKPKSGKAEGDGKKGHKR